MIWNRLAAFVIMLAAGGFFVWIWHDAGKTGVVRIGLYSFKRPQGQMVLRWFILAMAAFMVAFGVYLLFAGSPLIETQP